MPELVAESERDDSVTIGNDVDTLMSPSPMVTSEGARRGSGPDKEYPLARCERGMDIKMQLMHNKSSKREHLTSLCPATYPLNCGPNREPVNSYRIRR